MKNRQQEDTNIEKYIVIYNSIKNIVGGLIVVIISTFIILSKIDIVATVFFILMLLAGLAVLIKGIIGLLQEKNIQKANESSDINDMNKYEILNKKLATINTFTEKFHGLLAKLSIILFLIIWFTFALFMDFYAIKNWNEGGIPIFFASLFFWGFGIIAILKFFPRKIKIKDK